MKKNRLIVLVILISVGLILGGKWYMDREKDKQELVVIQTDLANYIYNNYVLFSEDKEKGDKLAKEYNNGKGNLTTKEYLDRGVEIRNYFDIEKIEFTSFFITPMNTVAVNFIINDVYTDDVILDTISSETNKRIYKINTLNEVNSYYLDKKNEPSDITIPENKIIYYKGGID